MNRRFRSIYLSAIAVAGTGLVGSFFITAAQADVWNKQRFVVATKHFIARHALPHGTIAVHPPALNK